MCCHLVLFMLFKYCLNSLDFFHNGFRIACIYWTINLLTLHLKWRPMLPTNAGKHITMNSAYACASDTQRIQSSDLPKQHFEI